MKATPRLSNGRALFTPLARLVLFIITLAAATTLHATPPNLTQGLLNYWDFEGDFSDTAGFFPDNASTSVDTGTTPGNVTLTGSGPLGQHANFPGGVSDFISVADSADITATGESLTISAWFRIGQFDKTWQALIAHGENSDYRIARQAVDPTISYAGGSPDIPGQGSGPNINDGAWHHVVAITEHGVSTRLWIDGSLIATGAAPTLIDDGSGRLLIGGNPNTPLDNFRTWNGQIDEIAMWNRPLDPTEIAFLHVLGQGGDSLSSTLGSTLLISSFSVSEGQAGSQQIFIPVQLTSTNSQTVSVTYTTSNGSAESPSDYDSTSGVVTFDPGETDKTIPVIIHGDTDVEQDEAFTITLSNPTNVTLSVTEITVTILDDDFVPPLQSGGIIAESIGGGANDAVHGVARDGRFVYMVGATRSTDFPVTTGAFQTTYGGDSALLGKGDMFVAKKDVGTGQLIWATYLGGDESDSGTGIAVDNVGNVFICGWTESTDFPTTNAHQSTIGGSFDGIIAKFDPDGNLLFSSFYGGTNVDQFSAITLYDEGSAPDYSFAVTGFSSSPNFPVTSEIGQLTDTTCGCSGNASDAVVMRFNADCSVRWSTFLGGTSSDVGLAIDITAAGHVAVAGWTESSNFPRGPFDTHAGGRDAFITRFDDQNARRTGSGIVGGSGNDEATGIVWVNDNNFFIAGTTASANFNVFNPQLLDLADTYQGGSTDAFLARYDEQILRRNSGFHGADGTEAVRFLTKDGIDGLWLGGETSSTDFPTIDPYQEDYAGGPFDGFITRFDGTLVPLIDRLDLTQQFATFFGGSENDSVTAGALVPTGQSPRNLAFGFGTTSSDFPGQPGGGGGTGGGLSPIIILGNEKGGVGEVGLGKANLLIDITNLDVENPVVGNPVEINLTVSNDGAADSVNTVLTTTLRGHQPGIVTNTTTGQIITCVTNLNNERECDLGILPANNSFHISIFDTFIQPTSPGTLFVRATTFSLSDPEGSEGTYALRLSKPVETPEQVDFGNIGLGATQTLPVPISNITDDDFEITGLDILGGQFELVDPPTTPFTIPQNDQVVVNVLFRPETETTSVDSFVISYDGLNSGETETHEVALRGTGRLGLLVTPLFVDVGRHRISTTNTSQPILITNLSSRHSAQVFGLPFSTIHYFAKPTNAFIIPPRGFIRPTIEFIPFFTGKLDDVMEIITDQGTLSVEFTGVAFDYYDYGDAPASYGTTLIDNGASHWTNGAFFGSARDAEPDAQSPHDGTGDDTGTTDDEDGVAFFARFEDGETTPVRIEVSGVTPGTTNVVRAWFDWNGDGQFQDPGERVISGLIRSNAIVMANVVPPTGSAAATFGETYARFRISSDREVGPTGRVFDGEVEDYRIVLAYPEIALSSTALNYGDVPTGTTHIRTVIVTNESSVANLRLSSITLTGSTNFTILGASPPIIVPPGGTTFISVSFRPTMPGNHSATLTINSNDPDEATLTVELTATGLGVPEITLDETALDFDVIVVSNASPSQCVEVENEGTTNLVVTQLQIIGIHASQFKLASPPNLPLTIEPGTREGIDITFCPTSTGTKFATLTIASNDPDEPTVTVELMGVGRLRGVDLQTTIINSRLVRTQLDGTPAIGFETIVRVENVGELNATGVRLEITRSELMPFFHNPNVTCLTLPGGPSTCVLPDLAPGASTTITYTDLVQNLEVGHTVNLQARAFLEPRQIPQPVDTYLGNNTASTEKPYYRVRTQRHPTNRGLICVFVQTIPGYDFKLFARPTPRGGPTTLIGSFPGTGNDRKFTFPAPPGGRAFFFATATRQPPL